MKRELKPDPNVLSADCLQSILDLISDFCRKQLNDEYAVLCRRMAEEFARQRPSSFAKGKPEVWASAIVRAIGFVNFLSDKSQTPHMLTADIDRHFGAASSSVSAKLSEIKRHFDLMQLEPEWTLPSRMKDNPLVWMLRVNGFIVDIRHLPRDAQVVAFEDGLIPYIPADR